MAKQPKRAGIKKVIFENSLLGGGDGLYEGRTPNPLSKLSMESGSSTTWGQVEDAFFERGVEEEREAMALYAKLPASALKEPRRLPVQPKHLLWAGCAAILIVASGIIVPRLMGNPAHDKVAISETTPVATTTTPTVPVATPAVAAAQPDPVPSPAAPPAAVAPAAAVAPTVPEQVAVATEPTVEMKPAAEIVPVAEAKPVAIPAPVAATKPGETPKQVVAEKNVETPIPAVVDEKPEAGDTGVALCRLGLEKRQSRSINEACAAALSADKSLASPLLKWTRGEFERGRTAIASAWASRIIAVDPAQADAYVIIGVAEQTAKRIPAARTAYKRYLELAPRGAFARDVRSALATM